MLCRPVKRLSRCTLPAQMLRNGRLCLKAVHKARPISPPGPCHGYTKAPGPGHGYRLRTRCLRSGPLQTAELAGISDSLQVILISAHAAMQPYRHADTVWPCCQSLARQSCTGHAPRSRLRHYQAPLPAMSLQGRTSMVPGTGQTMRPALCQTMRLALCQRED